MIRSTRAHRETKRHGLQGPGLIAGDLQTLDLGRDGDAVVADGCGGAAAAFGQEIADAFPCGNHLDGWLVT